MGWRRINNGSYYYQSRRVGGRVVKDYVPVSVAPFVAHLDAMERERRRLKWECERDERREIEDLDALVDRACAGLRSLARAGLVTAGYHRHKRQWRKRCPE